MPKHPSYLIYIVACFVIIFLDYKFFVERGVICLLRKPRDWFLGFATVGSSWLIRKLAKEIIKAIRKIQSQSTSNPSSVSQAAAVEALNGTQKFIKKRYKKTP